MQVTYIMTKKSHLIINNITITSHLELSWISIPNYVYNFLIAYLNRTKYDLEIIYNYFLNFDKKPLFMYIYIICIWTPFTIYNRSQYKSRHIVPKDYCSLRTIRRYQNGLRRFICKSIPVDNEIRRDLIRVIRGDRFFKDSGLKLSHKTNNWALVLNDNNMCLWLHVTFVT